MTDLPESAAATGAGEVQPPGPPLGRMVFGVLLMVGGLFWFLDVTNAWDVPWLAMFPVTLIVIGSALVMAARFGHNGGLIGLGVVLTVVVVITSLAGSVFDVRFEGGIGQATSRPVSITVLDDTYRHAVGQYTLDLRGVDFPQGTTSLEVTLGIGQLIVQVPTDMRVEIDARAGIGDVKAAGRESSGFDPHIQAVVGSGAQVLVLDARVGLGQVEVQR